MKFLVHILWLLLLSLSTKTLGVKAEHIRTGKSVVFELHSLIINELENNVTRIKEIDIEGKNRFAQFLKGAGHTLRIKYNSYKNNRLKYYTKEYFDGVINTLGIEKNISSSELLHNGKNKTNKQILVPDYKDPETIKTFGIMSRMAYQNNEENVGDDWEFLWEFGKEHNEKNKVGGIIFVGYDKSNDNNLAIISYKGTSTLLSDRYKYDKYKYDKVEDNQMFSCCCAIASATMLLDNEYCNCHIKDKNCDLKCVMDRNNYGKKYIYEAVSYYSSLLSTLPILDQVWTTGHSLGGALASITALLTNTAAFAFASPGELLYAYRMRFIPGIDYSKIQNNNIVPIKSDIVELSLNNDIETHTPYDHNLQDLEYIMPKFDIYHFGNDQDPIFNATCNGTFSICYWMGYILESRCHIGKECVYTNRNSAYNQNNQILSTNNYAKNNLTGFLYTHRMTYYLNNFILRAEDSPECIPYTSCLEKECTGWNFEQN